MTIREREVRDRNFNFGRFYEFDASVSPICAECPAVVGVGSWESTPRRCLGAPVHTNWPSNRRDIELVYVCESPSDRETSHGLPSIGRTGRKIYEREYGEREDGWLDILDDRVYRTNIVRCQADSGLQKTVDTTLKNQRVREAFGFCGQHLAAEIRQIREQCLMDGIRNLRVVLAIGKAFPIQAKQAADKIRDIFPDESINLELVSDHHPAAR